MTKAEGRCLTDRATQAPLSMPILDVGFMKCERQILFSFDVLTMLLQRTKLDEIKTRPGHPGHMVTITRNEGRKEKREEKRKEREGGRKE